MNYELVSKLKMAANVDSTEIFNNLATKIGNLKVVRTEGDWDIFSKTLDELNSINYRYTVITSPIRAVLLVNQCCSFIPTDDKVLVRKCSQLLYNLVNRQNVTVEGRTLTIAVHWCLNGLRTKDDTATLDILQALEALLRSNVDHSIAHFAIVELHKLIQSRKECALEILLQYFQCLEACTATQFDYTSKFEIGLSQDLHLGAELFMYFLSKPVIFDDVIYSKILKVCLVGLQNVITREVSLKLDLGPVLGIIKTYMLYGIRGVDYIRPQEVLPSRYGVPELPNNVLREKTGGKLTKQRKHRLSGANKKQNRSTEEVSELDRKTSGYRPVTTSLEYNSDSDAHYPADSGSGIKTSDSDFSDSEVGRTAKVGHLHGKIRQEALYLFYNIVKLNEKAKMFLYWTSFVPEGTPSGQHNLVTCILKDPSPRGRMAALNVLLLLLTSSKLYLLQAESTEKTTSFTAFSVVLGLTLKELHKGLSLALHEVSIPVLTQVLKCFAALVQATPYHKMSQGMITKVIRNVKSFIYYKDASVQVTALIVLGCVLASEPIVPDTKEAMIKLKKVSEDQAENKQKNEANGKSAGDDNFDFAQFSDPEEEEQVDSDAIPWLLKRCLSNLGVNFQASPSCSERKSILIPAPIKLESLQVLSAMSRNYFDSLMAPHIVHIVKALDISLSDKYTDLRLHAGRAVDFLGQAMNRYIISEDTKGVVSMERCLQFWQTLLNGSLIELLQSEDHSILRAVGCDCLGSIGAQIFEQLPRHKQVLCVTLLFSCTRDKENSVKGAAVRALAICVLYPSLREDSGFVVDTSEAIYRTLNDENLMVKVKASWSLGNLSDALVLNSKSEERTEEFPEELILKLLKASISGASDNDKIKMNAVRALGNLLQLITAELLKKAQFVEVTEQAFATLVNSSTTGSNMKVRWNACYALGSAMKNPALYGDVPNLPCNWQKSVFNSLMELVMDFRNLKVRINAALALSSPTKREHYGQFYQPVWVSFLKALEHSHLVLDLREFQHRDQLIEQLCLALGHLTTLLQRDDLLQLEDTIELYFDKFKTNTHKVLERLVPEKSTALSSASYTLSTLYKRTDLNAKQRGVVQRLIDVFTPDF